MERPQRKLIAQHRLRPSRGAELTSSHDLSLLAPSAKYAEELEPLDSIEPHHGGGRCRPRTEAKNPRRAKPLGRIQKQIIAVLKEQEAGMATADVCRRHGISSATFYKWKSKYGGLEVSDARRLRQLEQENERLKKLLADSMLDNAMLKEISAKKF